MKPGPGSRPNRKPRDKRLVAPLVIFMILLSFAAATTVTITNTSYADDAGFFLKPFYESANAPVTGCGAPCLTVDTQTTVPGTSGSFSLSSSNSMYLWTPQITSATAIPAGALSLQLFADLPAPSLDGPHTSGTWTTGTTFTITPFSTTNANDVIILSIQTFLSGSSVTVTSITDTSGVNWQASARRSFVSCTASHESTHAEWYGIATSAVSSDTITVHLSTTPTAASGIAFGVSNADTPTPFDPNSGLPNTNVSNCTNGNTAPTVTGVSTIADKDFVIALFGSANAATETAGTIGGAAATLTGTVIATAGNSNAAEYVVIAAALSSVSCTFGSAKLYWNVLCDALMPHRQTVTISYTTTNSAGTVQSTMISGSTATITAIYQGISLTSSAGTIPANGYIRVLITGPASALTVYWGTGKLTEFQVAYNYRS